MTLFILITIFSSTLGMMVRAGNVASIERQSSMAKRMTAGFDGYISRNKWIDTEKFANINYEEVIELLKKAHDIFGKTIIIVTHDPKIADYAKRKIQISDGEIVSDVF